MFRAIGELKDLDVSLQHFYEVSRILTKHCANYEAQALVRIVEQLLEDLPHDENAESVIAKVLQIQISTSRL